MNATSQPKKKKRRATDVRMSAIGNAIKARDQYERQQSNALKTAIVAVLVGLVLVVIAAAMSGCGGAFPAITKVEVEGTGGAAITLGNEGEGAWTLRLYWQEAGYDVDPGEGVDMVHCSVLLEASVNGLDLGEGYIPDISDARCSEVAGLAPFRGPFSLGAARGAGPIGRATDGGGDPLDDDPGDPGDSLGE